METYIKPPRRLPLLLRLSLALVERRLGKSLVANRILAWYPKAFWGSGILEALVAHGRREKRGGGGRNGDGGRDDGDDRELPRRLLKLIRMQVSFAVSCPFCIDMNSKEFSGEGITEDEILALRDIKSPTEVPSLSAAERAALAYARSISATPVAFEAAMIEELKRHFSERAIVIIASTAAQVNFWARLIQSFGATPAGFTTDCSILDLEAYSTRR
ncbi:MAG TPA: carboxymuconolactone decarboxylase family protein [Rectinemataceae bacterium]|nr:carboxymuconolactone decarboxylase family protein [Rectinemataceae bacterium]